MILMFYFDGAILQRFNFRIMAILDDHTLPFVKKSNQNAYNRSGMIRRTK